MRTQLLEDQPFYGVLVTKLKLVEDPSCDTMWTDGQSIGFNPKFTLSIAKVQAKGVLLHEVLHVVCKHPWRRGGRDPEVWNDACDYAINSVVLEAGYVLPGKPLIDPRFYGMSAEAIYFVLIKEKLAKEAEPSKSEPGDQGKEEGGQGSAADGSQELDETANGKGSAKGEPKEQAQEETPDFSQCVAGEVRDAPDETKSSDSEFSELEWDMAVQTAITAQGLAPGGANRLIKAAATSRINVREVLMDFLETNRSRDRYSWSRPSKRFVPYGIYMPSTQGVSCPPLVFAVDSSGSVSDADLKQAEHLIQAVMDEVRPEQLYVVFCDAQVKGVQEFEPGDQVKLKPKGGGGTDFRPVFDWVKSNASDAVGVVYLTDLMGTFPEKEAGLPPTIWIATISAQQHLVQSVPFGTAVQLPAPTAC